MEQQLFKLPKQHKEAIIKGLKLQIYQVSKAYQQVNFEIPNHVQFDIELLKLLIFDIFKRHRINPWIQQDKQHLTFVYSASTDFNFLGLFINEVKSITFTDLLDHRQQLIVMAFRYANERSMWAATGGGIWMILQYLQQPTHLALLQTSFIQQFLDDMDDSERQACHQPALEIQIERQQLRHLLTTELQQRCK